jgi:hypothetical protein
MMFVFGVWVILLGTRVVAPNLHPHVGSINQVIENIIHVLLILLTFKIYQNLSKDDKLVFKWFTYQETTPIYRKKYILYGKLY